MTASKIDELGHVQPERGWPWAFRRNNKKKLAFGKKTISKCIPSSFSNRKCDHLRLENRSLCYIHSFIKILFICKYE